MKFKHWLNESNENLNAILTNIKQNPFDDLSWYAFADHLEENNYSVDSFRKLLKTDNQTKYIKNLKFQELENLLVIFRQYKEICIFLIEPQTPIINELLNNYQRENRRYILANVQLSNEPDLDWIIVYMGCLINDFEYDIQIDFNGILQITDLEVYSNGERVNNSLVEIIKNDIYQATRNHIAIYRGLLF